MKLTVCWTARGRNKRFYHDICRKFGISDYMSINHETPCDIKDEDMEDRRRMLLCSGYYCN